uniref:Ovule protein n=1 Tax=Ascaris lumbricoides TaxID=6252 RepID=A0A0M3ISZ5_ASCLU
MCSEIGFSTNSLAISASEIILELIVHGCFESVSNASSSLQPKMNIMRSRGAITLSR